MFSVDSKKENLRNTSNMLHMKQGLNKAVDRPSWYLKRNNILQTGLPFTALVVVVFSEDKPNEQRKTLQVLQQTPDNRLTRTPAQLLQSGKGSQHMKKKVFPIFKDSSQTASLTVQQKKVCVHASSQTEGEGCCHCTCHEEEDEAFKLMGQEEIPEDYWQELAETRRQALEDSLHENELLHDSVGELRRENKRLSELVEHAEYFANILKEVSKEDSEDESEGDVNSEVGDVETEACDSKDRSSRESSDEEGDVSSVCSRSSRSSVNSHTDSESNSTEDRGRVEGYTEQITGCQEQD